MIQIDEDFMAEVGLDSMPEAEKADFMKDAEEELEVRIGEKISEGLSEDQLLEFDQVDNIVAAEQWLERYVPNFRDLARQVFQAFKNELAAERQQILG